jgi:hypothetical protein
MEAEQPRDLTLGKPSRDARLANSRSDDSFLIDLLLAHWAT